MARIHTLLVANRGEIARRVFATARRLGITTVAVHSVPDAQALHVREADRAFALGGAASADSYLRVDRILAAAVATGANAIHPGYGFLSENADFAQAVMDAGLIWVGPPPAAMRALGSKSAAKALALAHGVPTLPSWFGADQSDANLVAQAATLGFPLMVKAAAGGGGRGMRLVHQASDLPAALASARAEALAGFGNTELLLERALLRPRHVEVQVLADAHGHCIHLGERDCSVQRRHQKLIEESPSPVVDAALRAKLGAAAVALAQAAGYTSAGTVEFLLDGDEFFLMEMNTRLQVEHPVTEALTGLDLVEQQLRVAQGEPLNLAQSQVLLQGHAIEVRLCAEDAQFAPHTGTMAVVQAPAQASRFAPGPLRWDAAIEAGSVVSPHYDSMIAKLIVHAPTRAQACEQAAQALDALVLLGLPTNRALLAAMLRHPVFAAGDALIPFLAEHGDALRESLQKAEQIPPIYRALAAVLVQGSGVQAPALSPSWPLPLRLQVGDAAPTDIAAAAHGAGRWQLGQQVVHLQHGVEPSSLRLTEADGHTSAAYATQVSDGRWHVQALGVDAWARDLSRSAPPVSAAQRSRELRAPFNGKVAAVLAQAGDTVRRGQTLVVLESMKLEHQLAAPADGVLARVAVAVGQQVAPGLLLVELAEPAAPAKAAPSASALSAANPSAATH